MRNWLWLLISVGVVARAEPPPHLEIGFTLSRNGSPMADVTERLDYAGGDYQLTETWKGRGIYALLGSARRVSQGSIAQGTLRPREFFDERSGRDTARAWFDWQAGTLTMQYKGNKAAEPLPPNAQDRLSFLFAISLVPGKSDSVTYTIADGKGLSRHVYKVVGRERIRTPAGEFDTIKVARQRDERESAELWLAAERAFIPVRLVVVEKDGTRYEQIATRISR
jgi:uncharacterized protein DUF3108